MDFHLSSWMKIWAIRFSWKRLRWLRFCTNLLFTWNWIFSVMIIFINIPCILSVTISIILIIIKTSFSLYHGHHQTIDKTLTLEDCSWRVWMKTPAPAFSLLSKQRSVSWVKFERQRDRMCERSPKNRWGEKSNVSKKAKAPQRPGRLASKRKRCVSSSGETLL